MKRLQNKTALIANGVSGVGQEAARRFLAEGARVAITGPDAGSLKAAQNLLGGDVLPLRADSDMAGHADIARTLAAAFGKVDAVLINLDHSGETDLKWAVSLIRALLPALANPASVILNAFAGERSSSSAGAALAALARSLSAELSASGVRVDAIGEDAPSGVEPTETSIVEAALILASGR